jgi:hypothetical protein
MKILNNMPEKPNLTIHFCHCNMPTANSIINRNQISAPVIINKKPASVFKAVTSKTGKRMKRDYLGRHAYQLFVPTRWNGQKFAVSKARGGIPHPDEHDHFTDMIQL